MFLADTHADTLYAMGIHHASSADLMITPDKMRAGGVTLQTFALWTGPKGRHGDVRGIVDAELDALPALLEEGLVQVFDPREAREDQQSFMLSVEGGELFEESEEQVQYWYDRGVRMVAIVWNNENALAHPAKTGSTEGLTAQGRRIVREMQRQHMAVDTSHLNEAGFWDLFRMGAAAPMASHSCCRALCDHPRNLTDEQIREMIRGGGYIGMNFYPSFLSETGKADLSTVVRHIRHICDLGGEHILGFGSDFDGIETTPEGLTGAQDFPALLDALSQAGFSESTIRGFAGENLRSYYSRI